MNFDIDRDMVPIEQRLAATAGDIRGARNQLELMRVKNKSIVARAKKSIFNFPIFISQSIRINEAHIIAKMFERVYATFVQTVMAQNQRVSEDEFDDVEFLKKFHTNLDADLAESTKVPDAYNIYYKPIDFTDECLHDSLYKKVKLNENVSVIFKGIDPRGKHYDLIEMHKRLINEPLQGFSYLSEAPESVITSNKVTTSINNTDQLTYKDQADTIEDGANRYQRKASDDGDSTEKINVNGRDINVYKFNDELYIKSDGRDKGTLYCKDGSTYKTVDDISHTKYDSILNAMKEKQLLDGDIRKIDGKWVKGGQITHNKDLTVADPQFQKWSNLAADYGSAPKLLRDSDIKKINGMLPYTIEVKFMVKNFRGLAGDSGISIVIGVKSVLHIIQPKDLGDDIKDIILGNVKKIQKIRYTTGEIKFKDYLFGMTGAKKSAAQSYKGKKKWLSVLKRLGDYSKMYKSALRDPVMALNKGYVPIPNATMILTSLDVENIKANSGVDLNKISVVKILAKQLFLICFVIVDSSAGKMKVFYPDSDSDWDVQSLASVEADLAKTDNSELVKELNRVVNR